MTVTIAPLRSSHHRRAPVQSDPLAAALLVAVVAGLVALWIALAAGPSGRAPAAAARVALVVDAGGRPAAADVRYFAAQRYGRVIAVGPVARAAARSVAGEFPRTRFVVRSRMP